MKSIATLGLLVISGSALSQVFSDDFNRPDGPLGPNYTTFSGSPLIQGNAVGGLNGTGITLVNPSAFQTGTTIFRVWADISLLDTSAATFYAALLIRHNGLAGANNGLYVKFQRQQAGGFSHLGVYTGNNQQGNVTMAGGAFQALATPFTSARVNLWAVSNGSTWIGIDTNFDGNDEVTYESFHSLTTGNQVGFHVYGNSGRLDNFYAHIVPEPATIAGLGVGTIVLLQKSRRHRRSP